MLFLIKYFIHTKMCTTLDYKLIRNANVRTKFTFDKLNDSLGI